MTKGMTALHVTVGQSTEKTWLEVSSQILIISHSIFCMFQPYIVRPTVCWKLDWEELESNRQHFYALCSVLKERVSNFYALYILSSQNSKVKVRCVFIELNIFYMFNLGPVPFSQDHRSHCGFTASSNGDYILLSSRTFPFLPFWQFTTVEVYRSQGVDAT